MGIEDRDWYRDHHRELDKKKWGRRSALPNMPLVMKIIAAQGRRRMRTANKTILIVVAIVVAFVVFLKFHRSILQFIA